MTPPKPADSAKPVTPPPAADKPADKPAEAPKVEAKAEAKADAKVDTSAFVPGDTSSYTLRTDFGYGGQNFGNEQGIDHTGFHFKIAPGLMFRLFDDRLRVPVRLFYGYQALNKDLGAGVESTATMHQVGVESGAGYAFHPTWFSAYGLLGLGAHIYNAPESRDGMKGAEFNKNPLLFPLSGAGFGLNLGAELCTWYDAVCAKAGYTHTFGLNPTLEVVDGPSSAMGLNPNGFNVGLGIDILRVVDNIRGGGVAKPRGHREEPRKEDTPADAGKPGEGGKPAEGAKPGEKPVEGPKPAPALTGVALFEAKRDENKKYAEQAQKGAAAAKSDLDIVKLGSTDAAKAKAMATDAVASFRIALEAMNNANAVVADLEKQLPGLTGDDKTKAEAALKEARKSADESNKHARDAWDSASAAVKAYDKKRGSESPVDFPDTKPAVQGQAPKPTYKAPPKGKGDPAPKKDEPKKDEPKKDPPKKDEPKKDPPKPKGGTDPDF